MLVHSGCDSRLILQAPPTLLGVPMNYGPHAACSWFEWPIVDFSKYQARYLHAVNNSLGPRVTLPRTTNFVSRNPPTRLLLIPFLHLLLHSGLSTFQFTTTTQRRMVSTSGFLPLTPPLHRTLQDPLINPTSLKFQILCAQHTLPEPAHHSSYVMSQPIPNLSNTERNSTGTGTPEGGIERFGPF